MLKNRIIPCLLFKERTIIKSVRFKDFRMVGDPTTCARVFNERNADELIFLVEDGIKVICIQDFS